LEKRLTLGQNYDDLIAVPEIYCIFVPTDPNCAPATTTTEPSTSHMQAPSPAPVGEEEAPPTSAPSGAATLFGSSSMMGVFLLVAATLVTVLAPV
jgi:hypothetical protein